MKLSEIQSMWKVDCLINELNLGGEAANVPKLHSKYLELLLNSKLQLRKAESEYLRLRRNKKNWYLGELSEEELKELGWTPYLKKRPMKSDLDELISTDDEVIKQQDKYEYIKTMIFALDAIMKSISSRGWDIKTTLEYVKYTGGM